VKQIAILIVVILNGFSRLNAQSIKVAILDFENTSGISKYDGLGKAMSSMLITDIETNVSPKRLQLVERAQIQKILKEQTFQTSAAVDKSSSVKAGKLLGVKYLLIGDIYILNDVLIINARLTDTETGDIKFSKKQEGKITGWLTLKTNIAKDLATSLSQPFIEPTIPDKEVNVATLTTFGNAIAAKDDGKLEKAEELINTINEFSPDFKYLDDLKSQLDELKKQVENNTTDIKNLNVEITENITDYLELGYKYTSENNFVNAEKYFLIGLGKVNKLNVIEYLDLNLALSQLYYINGYYDKSIKYADYGLSIYPYFKEFIYFKFMSLAKSNRFSEFDKIIKFSYEIETNRDDFKNDSLLITNLQNYATINRLNYYDLEKCNLQWKCEDYPFKLLKKGIAYNGNTGEYYFNLNYQNIEIIDFIIGCIDEVYNDNPQKQVALVKQIRNEKNSIHYQLSLAWYTLISGDFLNAQNKFNNIILQIFWRIGDCENYGAAIPYHCGTCFDKKQYKASQMVKIPESAIHKYRNSLNWTFDPNKGLLLCDKYSNRLLLKEKDTIILKDPYWYYEDEEGIGFVTTNPINAYVFNSIKKYPIDALINCIKSSNCITWSTISEEYKMEIINWGHSHLLSGDNDIALKIYQLFPLDFQFGKDFQHLKYMQVLLDDWSDFEKLGLISHNKITELKQKLASSNKAK
jgi:TolB-like protein